MTVHTPTTTRARARVDWVLTRPRAAGTCGAHTRSYSEFSEINSVPFFHIVSIEGHLKGALLLPSHKEVIRERNFTEVKTVRAK